MVHSATTKSFHQSPPPSPSSEKAKRQVYILIIAALTLFLISTFILVEMLPPPTDMMLPSPISMHSHDIVSAGVGVEQHKMLVGVMDGQQLTAEVAGSRRKDVAKKRNDEKRHSLRRHNYHDRFTQKTNKEISAVEKQQSAAAISKQSTTTSAKVKNEQDGHIHTNKNFESKPLGQGTEDAKGGQSKVEEEAKSTTEIAQTTEPRLIHILETRFMQNQPSLIQLAKARLHLLQTICLPTVINQSAWGKFIWIIRTDPDLANEVKQDLVTMLNDAGAFIQTDANGKEHALAYVVGSNDNYIVSNSTSLSPNVQPFNIHAMLTGALSKPKRIFAGKVSSMQSLLDEISPKEEGETNDDIIMWTRLDADDGLNIGYMEYIQTQAVRYFLPDRYDLEIMKEIPQEKDDDDDDDAEDNDDDEKDEEEKEKKKLVSNIYTPPQWTYWCAGRNIDWFLTDPIHEPNHKNGTVYPVIHENVCVTPGVTVALTGAVDPNQVPRLDHDKIISYLRPKGGEPCSRTGLAVYNNEMAADDDDKNNDEDDGSCFHMVTGGVLAIRSRTPTSAGMMGIKPDYNQLKLVEYMPGVTGQMWRSMKKEFRVTNEHLLETNSYFAKHVYDIAEENARGQCTVGHSCKTSSKDYLQQYVDLRSEMEEGGFDIVNGQIITAESKPSTE